jgi:hypothetical protein
MPDPDTQRAINDTLRNVRSRIEDQFEKNRRKRSGDAEANPLLSERMYAYVSAMRIVSRFIEPVHEVDSPDA